MPTLLARGVRHSGVPSGEGRWSRDRPIAHPCRCPDGGRRGGAGQRGRVARSPAIPLNDCVSSDNGDPVLTGLSVTPSVDVTDAAEEVSFSLAAEDLGGPGPASGLRRVEISFGEPLVDDPADTFHALHEDASGAWVGWWWSNAAVGAGPWRINGVILRDRARNTRVLETHDLEQDGFPSSVEVTSTPDTSRPSIVSFRAGPRVVDTRRARQLVTFTAKRGRPGARVGEVDLFGSMPGASIIGLDGDFVDLSPVPGTSGTFRASVPVRRAVGSGIWKIRRVSIQDKVGNFRSYSYDRLGELGFSRRLRIISRVDARPPQLARFAMRPGRVDVRSQDGRVVVRAGAEHGPRLWCSTCERRRGSPVVRRTRPGDRDGPGRGVEGRGNAAALYLPGRPVARERLRTDRARNETRYGPAALAPAARPMPYTSLRRTHRRPRASVNWRVRPYCRRARSEVVSGITPEKRDPTPGLCAPQGAADLRAPRSGNMGVQEAEW